MHAIFRLGLLASLLVSCSSATHPFKNTQRSEPTAGEDILVNAGVGKESLLLTNAPLDAEDFRIEITGCRSGYSAVLTKADPDASLIVGDKHCVGKLTSFTLDGVVFTPSSAGFNSYEVGGSALFQNPSGTKTLKVNIIKQIASDLNGNLIDKSECQQVMYAFSGIDKAPGKVITPDPVGAKGKVVGSAPPAFSMDLALLLDVNNDGAGSFWFDLGCDPTKLSALQMATCRAQIPDVRYVLVEDTFGGLLTQAQADGIFAAQPGHAPGSAYANHFETVPLDGPDAMMLHPHMLLVLKYGDSYQYFAVKVGDLPDISCGGCDPVEPPVVLKGCETAYAHGETTFISLGLGNNKWGWQFDVNLGAGLTPVSGSKDLWAAAGQNDLSKGTLVGKVHYSFNGAVLNLTYALKPGAKLKATHVYAGSGNVTTTAPGQLGHKQSETTPGLGTYQIPFSPTLPALKVVAHADVCPA